MTGPQQPGPDRGDPNFAGYRPAPPPAWRADPDEPDDLSIVPGLGEGRTRPLDLSQDPDRFHPEHADPGRVDPVPELPRGLDPAYDPDRFRPPGQGQSLVDLLGKEGAHEEQRDGLEWVFGLVAVLAFLALVSFLFTSVLSP